MYHLKFVMDERSRQRARMRLFLWRYWLLTLALIFAPLVALWWLRRR